MADNFAQTVKQQTDIVKVIGEYVKLRKSGAQNWTGLCPFHKEKSPSFSVNAAHGYFYCFGCHEKGDVFTFVMKLESVSFPEAVRAVAGKMGIPLPARTFNSPEEREQAGLRKQLLDIHEAATQYFQQALRTPEAARAREYLTGRGLSAEVQASFRIGYAPDDFNHMREAMARHFNDEVMRASGLFSSKDTEHADGTVTHGNLYAKFRKRVTFPIAGENGKVIAFTARALDSADVDPKAGPKYMNSPETALYTKGNVLFNLDKAKTAMRELGFALLVEGQMDAISVFAAGVGNVVATSGTAFTEAQVRLLGRFARRVILNFDPDNAGANAAEKTLALLTEEGFEVRVITLPGGLDPDAYVRAHGVDAYKEQIRAAARHDEYLIERARTLHPPRTPEAKVRALNFLLPHIRRVPNAIARAEFADNAAQKLGIENSLVRAELKTAAAQRLESVRRPQAERVSEVERVLLHALVLPEADSARQLAARALGEQPDWTAGLPTAAMLESLALAPAPENPMDITQGDDERAMLAGALNSPIDDAAAPLRQQVEGALHTLEERALERRSRELRVAIAEASRRGDDAMLTTLMAEKVRVERRLRAMA